ncbi:hypothetical protein JM658_16425 [Joostella atrarenae]|uniref:Uncharacterized protein n=1 Tax=Joostella atrarenae TaxID=679257 RepID=A0ABS9J7N2_9FLAO|nr:hypothetical protein [Joostella atrarenae]MCF8716415.1 hypothetical protein [Joostella atrarenae]
MKKIENEVYRLKEGYNPFIYESETGLTYCFPVSSGHVDMSFEFDISEKDLEILKSSNYRFKALYFILFYEAQSTFGTGHSNPRRYTAEEFKNSKNKVLYQSENLLNDYIQGFTKKRNLSENYFESFSNSVF